MEAPTRSPSLCRRSGASARPKVPPRAASLGSYRPVLATRIEERVRALCLELPGTVEVEAWGVPTFRVGGRMYAMYAPSSGAPLRKRPAIWIHERSANQSLLLASEPARLFNPPYVGVKGWVGVWLDAPGVRNSATWRLAEGLLVEAHTRVRRR